MRDGEHIVRKPEIQPQIPSKVSQLSQRLRTRGNQSRKTGSASSRRSRLSQYTADTYQNNMRHKNKFRVISEMEVQDLMYRLEVTFFEQSLYIEDDLETIQDMDSDF